MNLDFDASRWDRVRENYRRWWAGDLDRPLIHLTLTGRDPGRPEPALPSYEFTSFYDLDIPAEAIADRWLYDQECRKFVGDASGIILIGEVRIEKESRVQTLLERYGAE